MMMLNNRRACRICLSTNAKLYHLEAFQLKTYYEEIINEVLTKDDDLLHFFCYQCSSMLQKYHTFRKLCIKSQESLKNISTQNLKIPFEDILKWEQYNNKIHPLIKKLDSTAKLGYFEYVENDIAVVEPFDVPIIIDSISHPESTNTYFDNKKNFESKSVVDEHNSDCNDDASENDFTEFVSKQSNNVVNSIASYFDYKGNFESKSVVDEHNDFKESISQQSNNVDNSIASYFDYKENFESKSVVDKHNTACNDYASENDFKEYMSQQSYNVNNSIASYFDNKEIFESKYVVDEHNSACNDNASKNHFEESMSRQSNNVDNSIASVSDEKNYKQRPSRKIAKSNSNGHGKNKKRSKSFIKLDPTKWKTVILTNEEALQEIESKIKNQNYTRFKYICEHCQRGFVTISYLTKHMACHSEANGKYECLFCKRRYAAKYKLNQHVSVHLEKYHCLRCPQVYSSKRFHLVLHERYHEGVQYVCPHCNEKFQKKTLYYSHLKVVHRSSHVCQYCDASFLNASALRDHRNNLHKSKNTGDLAPTRCVKCDLVFESPEALKEHKRSSAKHVTEKICFLNGQSKWNPQYKECDQCGKKFTSTAVYNRHMERAHNKSKQLSSTRRTICEICGTSVVSRNLPMHMNVHNVKRFPCPDCDKVYNHLNNLERHRQVHKDPKPFTCELCGKKFSSKAAVQLHVRTVHLKQPQPPRNRTGMKFASLGKKHELQIADA